MLWKRIWERAQDGASPQQNLHQQDQENSSHALRNERRRRGRLLATLLIVLLPLNVLFLVTDFLQPQRAYLVTSLFNMALAGVSLLLNRRGRTRAASIAFLLGITLRCAVVLLVAQPGPLPGFYMRACYTLTILTSGVLLGRWKPFGFALLGIVLASIEVSLRAAHPLPGFPILSPIAQIAIPTVFLSILACLSSLATASMEEAFAHAEAADASRRASHDVQERLGAENEAMTAQAQELAETNRKLLEVQAQLEAQYRAMEAANEQLAAWAITDGMTSLANHRAFQEEMAREVARAQRANAPLSLLLLDVDYFKKYNDEFGHPAGDEVLKTVARLLQEVVREGDFTARYGGEEFAVILPDSDVETAAQVAERVRAAVEIHTFPHRPVTVSIGVAQRHTSENAAATIQRADTALYEAKSAGRNRVVALEDVPETLSREHEPLPNIQSWYDEFDAFTEVAHRAASSEERLGENPASEEDPLYAESDVTSLMPEGDLTEPPAYVYGGVEGLLQENSGQILAELLAAIDKRSTNVRGHAERVTRYTLRLGRALAELYDEQRDTRPLLPRITESDLANFAFGALLHDIGKIGIPDSVLRKMGKLTDEEWRQLRRHPLAGAELIAEHPTLTRALPIVRYHHERWDGEGYPQGLAGEAIPLAARVFAICDTLDSLTTDRPYRTRMTYAAARAEISNGAGTQFDPDVVEAFLRIPEEDWQQLSLSPSDFLYLRPVMTDIPRAA